MTTGDQPGLRMRLAHEARRIASQHAYLGALEASTLRALDRGDPDEMREALAVYEGSLEAHFALEEQVHFPALRGLHAELTSVLRELVAEHDRFRAELRSLVDRVPPRERDGIAAAFRALAAALKTHEQREEQLWARVPQR